MSENVTKLNFNEYQQLYEQIGSKNLGLQADIAKEITTNQLDLYMKTVDFIYRIISVLGIFAGFGFTALDYVSNFNMFIVGEGTLLLLILVGLFFIPKVYISEYNALETSLKNYNKEVFIPRNEVLGNIVKEYIENEHIRHSDMEAIQMYDKKLLEIMEVSDKEKKNPFEKPIYAGLVLSAIGLILIIMSFYPFVSNSKSNSFVNYRPHHLYHDFRR